jgi:hypothetical protein
VGFFVDLALHARIVLDTFVFESKTRSPTLQNTMDQIVAATPADLPGELPTNCMVVYSGGG